METFVDLKGFEEKYEINTVFHYEIRNQKTNKLLSENLQNGYIRVNLNCIKYQKHRLIALQFIQNPEKLDYVDHINHIRSDNRIQNLRWVSSKENSRNKSIHKNIDYNFIDYAEFNDDDLMVVDEYNDHEFKDYYYNMETNRFYYDTGVNYRELHINYCENGLLAYVNIKDIDNKNTRIYLNKFKKIHDII